MSERTQQAAEAAVLAEEDEGAGGEGRGRSPLVQRVYRQLATQIEAGAYETDERLPGEHQLAAQFLVSRPVVREALSRLRDDGVIYSRRGAGSFVKARAERPNIGYPPVETIADIQRCYEFRLTIEPDCAYQAALRWNAAALEAIAAALGLMRDATAAHKHREDADFAFHCAIAAASNNHYYLSSIQALRAHIAVGMKFHGVSLLGPQPLLAGVFDEHSGIYEAIRRRDAAEAQVLMRRHLEGSRDRVFEGKMLDLSL